MINEVFCLSLLLSAASTTPVRAEIYNGIPGGCCFFGSPEVTQADIPTARPERTGEPFFVQLSGQVQYVEVDTLIVIYTHYRKDASVAMDLSAADILTLQGEVEESKRFIWRSSNLKCLMKTDYLIVDRTLTLDDLWDFGGGAYWLHHNYWGPGATTVEQDLHDAGIVDYQYSVILVLYAFENSTGANAAIGGGAYGVNTTMGDAAYIAIPLAWGLNSSGVITHEYLHALDSVFDASGNPAGNDMHHADHPETFPHLNDSGRHFNFLISNTLAPTSWLQLRSDWATAVTAADNDDDDVPDTGLLPITEELLGSNSTKQDTDGDGLSDFGELIATYYSESDTLAQDSDGDGLLDGADPYPLYSYSDHVALGLPVINGAIEAGEYTEIVRFNKGSTDIAAVVHAAWSDDLLCIAAQITDDMLSVYYPEPWWSDNLEINIDSQKDGWHLKGDQNYRFYVVPRGASGIPDVFGHNYYYDAGSDSWHEIDVSAITARYAAAARPNGYVVELAIPASVMPGVEIMQGSSLRLTFQVEDYDTYPGWPNFNVFSGRGGDEPGFAQLYLAETAQHTLAVSSCSGGSVTNPGEGSFRYEPGTIVPISATPQANYSFVNWTGTAADAGKVADRNAASTTVTVDADYTLRANFAEQVSCVYDLDGSGSIGPGDFALFACCWLEPATALRCSGPATCATCDFDCSGLVGPGDFGFFAGAWLKNCDDPSIQWPPCRETAPGSLGVLASTYSTPDVKVCSVTLASPSASDTTETLPTSVSSLTAGQDYYVEVWAGDMGSTDARLTSVYVDLDLNPCGAASIQSIDHGGIYTVFESGTAGACRIDELGGSSLSVVAKEPQLARVAIVRIHAEASGPVTCSLRPSTTGIAASGRGLIPWSQIELSPRGAAGCLPDSYSTYSDWLTLGRPDCWCAPYQCDGDADGVTQGIRRYRITSNDLDIVNKNWKKIIDDPTLDPCADIDQKPQGFQKYRVMSNDLAILIANWKKTDADLAGDCPRPE
ncbi:MAG: hypothetical protein AMJ75_00920 [Phycisphaerae bacterium SM1_79]|nr:MAG: hypothetical protein AMJ75_00920 [Phycisphaerae bacterium SM1_79]